MGVTLLLALLFACGPRDDDQDADGVPVGEDCSDLDASVGVAPTWYLDADGDGYGVDETTTSCVLPDGYAEVRGDCDDTDPTVYPGAREVCNDADDSCDGLVDEGLDKSGWYADGDGDGQGNPALEVPSCTGEGLVRNQEDCDDSDASVGRGADEVCNGADDDCDGLVDEEAVDVVVWYRDTDGDGYGAGRATEACFAPGADWVTDDTDCDDRRASDHPGAAESCDGRDNDCDGTVDGPDSVDALAWLADADGDGYGDDASVLVGCTPAGHVLLGGDCDDTDAAVNPETEWFLDGDGDGYGDATSFVVQCAAPGGYVTNADDCDDSTGAVSPGAAEVCDGTDNDCDGAIDLYATDAPTWYMDFDGDGYGNDDASGEACTAPTGFIATGGDCDDLRDDVNPDAVEYCDDADNDCDGLFDLDDPSATDLVWYADRDGDGFGDLTVTTLSCWQPDGFVDDTTDCDDADPAVYPGAPGWCDGGRDNDCDGLVDAADPDEAGSPWTWYRGDADGDDWAPSDSTTVFTTCASPPGYARYLGDCDDTDPSVNPAAVETWYDGVDADCDGADDFDRDGDGDPSDLYGGLDCDDTDPFLSGTAMEHPIDGQDNDCDGLVDLADPDVTLLSLSDDSFATRNLTVNPGFPFCGSTRTTVYVGSNGYVTLGRGATTLSESGSSMYSYGPIIAALFDDLDPSSSGSVYFSEGTNAVGAFWVGVPQCCDTDSNDFSIIMYTSGQIRIEYGNVTSSDFISGWHCGAGHGPASPTANIDLSEDASNYPYPDTLGMGQGTEGYLFEQFNSSSVPDVANDSFLFCGQTDGTDLDEDGWTTRCGDLDDDDPLVHP